jgi:2-haloacid dehalogenase
VTGPQEWRNGYLKFVREIAMDSSKQWKTVDEHHLESLREILTGRGLIFPREDNTPDALVHDGSLWDEAQLQELNLVWHRLDPWSDTCKGLNELNRQFSTCTLSNGNLSLLQDMVEHGKMPFTHIYSAEMFQSYKPSPKVYLGAAKKMGLKPEECALVAAHLDDLKAAKSNGFSTIYVERPREERRPELGDEGIVDIWVKEGEAGFVTAAERLGINVQS